VTITGTNFVANSTATIGGQPAQVTYVNASTLLAIVPPHAFGPADVSVTSFGLTGTAPGAFFFALQAPLAGGVVDRFLQ
jgi:hypothetical protein